MSSGLFPAPGVDVLPAGADALLGIYYSTSGVANLGTVIPAGKYVIQGMSMPSTVTSNVLTLEGGALLYPDSAKYIQTTSVNVHGTRRFGIIGGGWKTYTAAWETGSVVAGGNGVLGSVIDTLTYGNGLFVGSTLYNTTSSSGSIVTSTDGITWASVVNWMTGINQYITDLQYLNGIYIGVGSAGKIATSYDGITWTTRSSTSTSSLSFVTYGNGLYIAGGSTLGTILVSTDAVTWTTRATGITYSFDSGTYGNGTYVLGTAFGLVVTSTNGVTWTSRATGLATNSVITALTYGNGIFLAATAGPSSGLGTSTDGVTWTARTSGFGTSAIRTVVYGNGLYAIGGDVGKLSVSTDGVTWTSVVSNINTSVIYTIAYGGGLFVAGSSFPNRVVRSNMTSYPAAFAVYSAKV